MYNRRLIKLVTINEDVVGNIVDKKKPEIKEHKAEDEYEIKKPDSGE